MKNRKHHNNKGYRGIKNGRTAKSLEHMTKRIFRKRLEKVGNALFVKEKHDELLAKDDDR